LLTFNPLFSKQVGKFADQEGLGFEYGWRGEYAVNKRWGLALEMFGEIEDLANAGSFNDQTHSLGPTLLINFGGDETARTAARSPRPAPTAMRPKARSPVHRWCSQ